MTEAANMALKEALIKSMERQKTMQEKLTDMEGRSRRNNIRITKGKTPCLILWSNF